MRNDWTRAEISAVYHQPLLDLLTQAQNVHRKFHPPNQVQMCRLLSIKTGGCPEDCGYCPQSAHYQTDVERQQLMNKDEILSSARMAKAEGATRFCMGAAWRQAPQGREFDSVLESVRGVADLGMEVCCTLGILTEEQAQSPNQPELTAHNHNLDTSPEFYSNIISTRTYQERLATISTVSRVGITVCCGGVCPPGEADSDRIRGFHE